MSAPCIEVKQAAITVKKLRDNVDYDPETGIFRWVKPKGRLAKAGFMAGTKHGRYTRICIDGVFVYAHRLAWLDYYGEWPPSQVDHINGDGSDNRISNLRLANPKENARNQKKAKNNSSGFKGVNWHKATGKWVARIYTDEGRKSLGYFDSAAEAGEAYRLAAIENHKEFAKC